MANFNDITPAAPLPDSPHYINGKWQKSGRNVSVYFPKRPDLVYKGTIGGAATPGPTFAFIPYQDIGQSVADLPCPTDAYIRNVYGRTQAVATAPQYFKQHLVKSGLITDLAILVPTDSAIATHKNLEDVVFLPQGAKFNFDTVVFRGAAHSWRGFGFEYAAVDGSSLLSSGPFGIIPSTTTDFLAVAGARDGTTETEIEIKIPFACTIDRMYITTSTTQPASGTLDYVFRKNLANTLLAISIPAGNAGGTYADLVNSVSVSAGDTVCISATNNGTANSASITHLSFRLTPSSSFRSITVSHYSGVNFTADRATNPFGHYDDPSVVTSDEYAYPCPLAGTIRNMYAWTSAVLPGATGTFTYTLYKNGIPTSLVLTNTGAAPYTKWGSDLTHSVSVVPGDLLWVLITRVAGTHGGVGGGHVIMEFEAA